MLAKMLRDLEVVEEFRTAHAEPLVRVTANLRYYVAEVSLRDVVVGRRLKRMNTIINKLGRYPGMSLSRMNDIAGCRAVLPTQAGVDHVIERLQRQRRWHLLPRVWDYVAQPKEDGYQAKHLVALKDAYRIEIQLRTLGQHQWAELVERLDRDHGTRIKFGEIDDQLKAALSTAAATMAAYEQKEVPLANVIAQLVSVELLARRER